MNIQTPIPATGSREGHEHDPWIAGFRILRAQLESYRWFLLGAVLAGGLLGAAAAYLIPPNYTAKSQIYIDPGDNRTFSGDSSLAGQLDANSQINLVQSEIGVILSEPVLLRAVRDEAARNNPPQGASAGDDKGDQALAGQSNSPVGKTGPSISEASALLRLQRAVTVSRNERSFLVEIAVKDRDPEKAARLANGIVTAYLETENEARDQSNSGLAKSLGDRIQELRSVVMAADQKVEAYRVQHNLTGQPEKETPDPVSSLIERRQTSLATVAQLSATLGDRHPDLVAAREQLASLDTQIQNKLIEIEDHRKAKVELNLLQAEADANRKIFEDFQKRYREASEYGRLKASNLRIISLARPPTIVSATRSMILYSIFGGIFAAMLVLIWCVLRTLVLPLSSLEARFESRNPAS